MTAPPPAPDLATIGTRLQAAVIAADTSEATAALAQAYEAGRQDGIAEAARATRGACTGCGQERPLYPDGTVTAHDVRDEPCVGQFKMPKGDGDRG